MKVSTTTAAMAATAAVVALVGLSAAYVALSGTPDRFAQCRRGVASPGTEIGGPFTLASETGAMVSEKDAITRPSLLYFGYSYCPDVCPIDSTRNAAAVDLLAEQGHDVRAVIISVDSERDTPQSMAEFTDLMSPKMLGLSGTKAQVDAAVKAYRAYYRVDAPGDPETLIDHSTQTYLMDPKLGFLDYYDRGATPEEVAQSVGCFLDVLKTNDKPEGSGEGN